MNITLLTWGATILGGVGLWLVLSRFFDGLVGICYGLVNYIRRFIEPAAVKWLRDGMDPNRAEEEITRKYIALRLSDMLVAWVVLAAILAVLLHDKLLSPVVFGIVVVAGEIYMATRRSQRLARLNADVANLILQFASRYPLKRSISGTMEETVDVVRKGELRDALEQTRSLMRLNRPSADAFKPLRRLKNPTVRQFVTLLSDAQETSPEVLEDVMGLLQKDVRNRSSLFGEIRQSLTILRITTRALQAVLASTLLIAAVIGNWRSYFLESNSHWGMLIVMIILGMVSSFYVELEIQQLEEA